MSTTRKYVLLIFVLILILGAGLRVYQLDKDDIWYDESLSIKAAGLNLPDMFRFTFGRDVTHFPPIYYIFLKFWILLFGNSAFSVRMTSVLFGILSLPVLFGIGKILWDEKHGLLAMLFFSLSPFHIYYSQETRAYALKILFILITIYFFVRYLRYNKSLDKWGYILSMVVAIYIHFLSLFIWGSIFLIHGIYERYINPTSSNSKNWYKTHLWVILCISPLILIQIIFHIPDLKSWIQPFNLLSYRDTLFRLVFGVGQDCSLKYFLMALLPISLGLGRSLFHIIQSIQPTFSKKENRNKIESYIPFIPWLLFIVPVLLFTLVSVFIDNIYSPGRYLLMTLPVFILILTHGLFLWSGKSIRISGFFLSICIFVLAFIADLDLPYRKGMRSVAEYISIHGNKDDLILFIPGYHQGSFQYYYSRQIHYMDYEKIIDWEKDIGQAVQSKPRTWLIIDQDMTPYETYIYFTGILHKTYPSQVDMTTLPPYGMKVLQFNHS